MWVRWQCRGACWCRGFGDVAFELFPLFSSWPNVFHDTTPNLCINLDPHRVQTELKILIYGNTADGRQDGPTGEDEQSSLDKKRMSDL